jgi:hypothetical protein
MPRQRPEQIDDTFLGRRHYASPREFIAAYLPRQLIEHGIDHAGFVGIDEGMRDIRIF